MSHLDELVGQFDDQLRRVDINGTDEAVYHYDAAGQRVLKLVREGQYEKTTVYVDGPRCHHRDVPPGRAGAAVRRPAA